MYGVVAGQKQSSNKSKQRRDQNAEDKDPKKRGLTGKLMQYVKRRLNPPSAAMVAG